MNKPRLRLWHLPLAIALAGGLGAWVYFGDIPFVAWPRATPPPPYCEGLRLPLAVLQPLRTTVDIDTIAGDLGRSPARLDNGSVLMAIRAASRPPEDRLWNTQLGTYATKTAVASWQAGRRVSLAGFAPWELPKDLSWQEDPYGNVTWRIYLHSLGWLLTAEAASVQPGKEGLKGEVVHYLVDWLGRDESEIVACDEWNDFAVALRTEILVRFATGPAVSALDDVHLARLIEELGLHGRMLARYLEDPQWSGHNHQVFHALSLYTLAVAFPELAGSTQWRERALERIHELPSEMVEPVEGVSLEQSPSYHYVAIDLLVRAQAFLVRAGESFPPDTRAQLGRMLDFAAVITRPDGSLPAIGDTAFGANADFSVLQRALDAGVSSEMARYIVTRGENGKPPPDTSFYPRAGYAVFRKSGSLDRGLVQVVVDMSPSRKIHGHDDALNILVWANGHEVIVDSGGPYAYGDPGRFDFVIAPAHNLLLIEDEPYLPGDVAIGRLSESRDLSMAEGSHLKYAGYRVTRAVIFIKQLGRTVVIDRAERITEPGGEKYRVFDLMYHVPPDAVPVTRLLGQSEQVEFENGAISVVGSAQVAVDTLKGEESPLRGWVTPRYAQKVAAPVVTFSSSDQEVWFVTLIEPLGAGEAPTQSFRANRTDDGTFVIAANGSDGSWELRLPPSTAPQITFAAPLGSDEGDLASGIAH